MYIVCSPQQQIKSIIDLLDKQNISSYPLPLVDFHFDPGKFKYLNDNINNFDYVMLSSPSVIYAIQDIIKKSLNTKFITVGAKSALAIKNYTDNEIIYPNNISGREELLVNELPKINFNYKKVLIIKGENSIKDSYNSYVSTYPDWQIIDIYSRITLHTNEEDLKNLLKSDQVQGIIITTSSLVDDLFALAKRINCEKLIQKKLFMTIHPKIAKKLYTFGVTRVLLTKTVNKEEIVHLIGGLHV